MSANNLRPVHTMIRLLYKDAKSKLCPECLGWFAYNTTCPWITAKAPSFSEILPGLTITLATLFNLINAITNSVQAEPSGTMREWTGLIPVTLVRFPSSVCFLPGWVSFSRGAKPLTWFTLHHIPRLQNISTANMAVCVTVGLETVGGWLARTNPDDRDLYIWCL